MPLSWNENVDLKTHKNAFYAHLPEKQNLDAMELVVKVRIILNIKPQT